MPYAFPPDLQQLINIHLATGRFAHEDDVLRAALKTLQEVDDDAAAVQAALDELRDGDDGLDLDQAFDEVRASHAAKRK